MIKKFIFLTILLSKILFSEEVKPVYGKVEFKEGKIEKCAYFNGENYLQYPIKYLKANAGTIELWVKTDKELEKINFQPILSAGTNSPLWFLIGLNQSKIFFLYKNGTSPYKKEGEFYASVSTTVKNWDKDQWHHLAFVWGSIEKGKSFIQIYVDGKLKEDRYNLTLGDNWPENIKIFGIGYNTANLKGEKFEGFIDEVRISNKPRTKKEIEAEYEKIKNGKSYELDSSTLLLLDFNDKNEGVSITTEKVSKETLKQLFEEILKEIL